MQKTRKGQLCLQKVSIAVLRPANHTGWAVSLDVELVTTGRPTVPTGATLTSSDVPSCRFHTLK
jgi:hypothetical protein